MHLSCGCVDKNDVFIVVDFISHELCTNIYGSRNRRGRMILCVGPQENFFVGQVQLLFENIARGWRNKPKGTFGGEKWKS
jgi:hypothetical protein